MNIVQYRLVEVKYVDTKEGILNGIGDMIQRDTNLCFMKSF
jgi:hypothetical protein